MSTSTYLAIVPGAMALPDKPMKSSRLRTVGRRTFMSLRSLLNFLRGQKSKNRFGPGRE
jgi:hypothetical protein